LKISQKLNGMRIQFMKHQLVLIVENNGQIVFMLLEIKVNVDHVGHLQVQKHYLIDFVLHQMVNNLKY